jgi:hypothetical protein
MHNIFWVVSYSSALSARMYHPKHFSIVASGQVVNTVATAEEKNIIALKEEI